MKHRFDVLGFNTAVCTYQEKSTRYGHGIVDVDEKGLTNPNCMSVKQIRIQDATDRESKKHAKDKALINQEVQEKVDVVVTEKRGKFTLT